MRMTQTTLFVFAVICLFTTHACITQSDCHNNGDCVNGMCKCAPEWKGNTCDQAFCRFGQILSNGACHCDWGQTLRDGVCTRQCLHGHMSMTTGKCVCDPEWKTAGITDTIDYIKGSCAQFQCQSNTQCRKLLPNVPDATCPVVGWNCDCGFAHAGYSNDHVGCMNSMYVLNIHILRFYRFVCTKVFWCYGLLLAGIALPFGRRRERCDCRRSWWIHFQRCAGYHVPTCDGRCPYIRQFRFRDEFALTIWTLKVTVWLYLFASFVVLLIAFLWTLIVWVCIALILVAVAIIGCIGACSEGGGDGCSGDGCTGCADNGCGGCCGCCDTHHSQDHWSGTDYGTVNNYNILVYPYSYPYGYGYGYGYGSDTCCDGCCQTSYSGTTSNQRNKRHRSTCCCCFYPLIWMIHTFPSFPENLQGGIVGLCLGTHVLRRSSEMPHKESCIVHCLSLQWSNWAPQPSHLNEEYRGKIRTAMGLTTDYPVSSTIHREREFRQRPPVIEDTQTLETKLTEDSDELTEDSGESIELISPVQVYHTETVPFDKRIYNYEYMQECGICLTTPNQNGVALWSCGHIICKECSDNLISKQALCVYCKRAPWKVDIYPQ